MKVRGRAVRRVLTGSYLGLKRFLGREGSLRREQQRMALLCQVHRVLAQVSMTELYEGRDCPHQLWSGRAHGFPC